MAKHRPLDHQKSQERAIEYIRKECAQAGINDAGAEKAVKLIRTLHDLSCELGFEMVMGVIGVGPKGGQAEFLDRICIEMMFDDAEEVREAAALEMMRRERSN